MKKTYENIEEAEKAVSFWHKKGEYMRIYVCRCNGEKHHHLTSQVKKPTLVDDKSY